MNMPRREFIEKIRSFNRFYTNVIGLLDQHFLNTSFSLTEGRVLYEINTTENCSARRIREKIAIDEGYLSRIIDKFIKQGWVTKAPSASDRRLHIIVPTSQGRKEFSKLNQNQNRLIAQLIEKLSEPEQRELVSMMDRIQALLRKAR